MLDAYVNRDGEDLAQPSLLVAHGGTAIVQIGSSDGANNLQDGVRVTLSPLAD